MIDYHDDAAQPILGAIMLQYDSAASSTDRPNNSSSNTTRTTVQQHNRQITEQTTLLSNMVRPIGNLSWWPVG